jgi:hypothetical protein
MNVPERDVQGVVSLSRRSARGGDLPARLLENSNELKVIRTQRRSGEDTYQAVT